MEVEAIGFWEIFPLEEHIPEGMDLGEGISEYPLLPDAFAEYENDTLQGTDYEWVSGQPYANDASLFAACYSFGNDNTYFDYDENYMLNFGDALTRGDAIRAAERLYETVRMVTYAAPDAITYGVTEETISLASEMPAVTYNDLPDWKVHNIETRKCRNSFGLGRNYSEEEIQVIAESGFHFIRVPLQFDQFFDGKDTSRVCSASLESLDNLLNWCAGYGIHVCFDLHDMPGYTTNGDDSDDILFWDEETQKLFAEFWQFMANRYKDVPSNLLSFNLLNEPHGNHENELTDAVYSDVMKKAIYAVQEVSPDRLMISGTLGVTWGTPVQGLANEKVAQGFSGYILAHATEQRPYYFINQCFNNSSYLL